MNASIVHPLQGDGESGEVPSTGSVQRTAGLSLRIVAITVSIMGISALAVGGVVFYDIHRLLEQEKSSQLDTQVRITAIRLEQAIDSLRSTAHMLSETPPVAGIVRARRNDGWDDADRSTEAAWRERLATTFVAALRKQSSYSDMRLIDFSGHGGELVRVERSQGEIRRVPEQALRQAADQIYVRETVQLAAGQVYLSVSEPADGAAVVERTHQPIIWAAIPVYDGERAFGALVITAEFNALSGRLLGDNVLSGSHLYITDHNGDWLYHPADSQLAEIDGRHRRIQEALPALAGHFGGGAAPARSTAHVGSNLVSFAKIPIDARYDGRFIGVALVAPYADVVDGASALRYRALALSILLVVVAAVLTAGFVRRQIRPLRALTNSVQQGPSNDSGFAMSSRAANEVQALASALNGMWRQVRERTTALETANRELASFSGFISDNLRKSEARQRAIFEHAGIGIRVSGEDGYVIETNHAWQQMLGYSADELVGAHWSDSMHPADLPTAAGPIEYPPCSESPLVRQERYLRKDGSTLWARTTVTSVDKHDGSPRYVIALIADITGERAAEQERERYEEELRAARLLAEQASEAKTRFLATASHDLRQPIQAIHLLAHLLVSDKMPPSAAAIAGRMQSAVEGLGQMIDALLDISKLDAGLIEPVISDFRIGDLIAQLVEEHMPLAQDRNLVLKSVHSSVWVQSDWNLLGRILRNLITNAIKYTPEGTVLVGVRRVGRGVRIEVHDTGVGIGAEDFERIFDEFQQIGNVARDRREGLGLGLAIVKRLAALLGCQVGVASVGGRGSCFSLVVPLACGPARIVGKQSRSQLVLGIPCEGDEILVVDDEIDIREGLEMSLGRWGYAVATAEDFDHAMESLNPERPPVLVIADYRLGARTGLDVIQAIRRRTRRNVAALLLTGDVTKDRTREATAAGVQLLRKPISPEHLRAAITEAIQNNEGGRRHRRR